MNIKTFSILAIMSMISMREATAGNDQDVDPNRAVFAGSSSLSLKFHAIQNHQYTIKTSQDLETWTVRSTITATTDAVSLSLTNNGDDCLFFRVVEGPGVAQEIQQNEVTVASKIDRAEPINNAEPSAMDSARLAQLAPQTIFTHHFGKELNTAQKDMALQDRRAAWDAAEIFSTAQGIVNKSGPIIYLFSKSAGGKDQFWLNYSQNADGWLAGRPTVEIPDLVTLIKTFQSSFNGAVIWDEKVPATANVALSLAGIQNLIPIRYDTTPGSAYELLVASNLLPAKIWLVRQNGDPLFTGKGTISGTSRASTTSPKCDAYYWFLDNYLSKKKGSGQTMGYREDAWWITEPGTNIATQANYLLEYDDVVCHGNFAFDLSPWPSVRSPDVPRNFPPATEFNLRLALLEQNGLNEPGKFFRLVGFRIDDKYTSDPSREGITENQDSLSFSSFNVYHSIGASANASFFQWYPAQTPFTQNNLPTVASLKADHYLTQTGGLPANTVFVSFYDGDFDGSLTQEVLYEIAPESKPTDVPFSWGICPGLEATFPLGLAYLYRTKSPTATIVAGTSGPGYLNPGGPYFRPYGTMPKGLSGLAPWKALGQELYPKWGMSLTGFIVEGTSGQLNTDILNDYASFSPNGIVTQFAPPNAALNNKTPAIVMQTPYYNGNVTNTVINGVVNQLKQQAPGTPFFVYRLITYSPSHITAIANAIQTQMKKAKPTLKVNFVDLYTLMLIKKTTGK